MQSLEDVPGSEDGCDLEIAVDSDTEDYLKTLPTILKAFSKR